MTTPLAYVAASVAETAGCFAFWAWLRLDKSMIWIVPGLASPAAFAWLLTLVDSTAAGRAYAAYGGVYIARVADLAVVVEGLRPDRWDAIGAAIGLLGASLILCGSRPA